MAITKNEARHTKHHLKRRKGALSTLPLMNPLSLIAVLILIDPESLASKVESYPVP